MPMSMAHAAEILSISPSTHVTPGEVLVAYNVLSKYCILTFHNCREADTQIES